MPGLMSTHGHLMLVTPSICLSLLEILRAGRLRDRQTEWSLADCVERGITHIQDSLTYDLRQVRGLRRRISLGAIRGPRIHQAVHVTPEGGAHAPARSFKGRLMRSMAGVTEVDYERADSGIVLFEPGAPPGRVREAVDRAVDERGAESVIKLYDQKERVITYKPGATMMTQDQIDAAADQARKRGLRSAIHIVTVESMRRALRGGVDSLIHVPIDGPLAERDVGEFAEAACTIEPTLTIAWNYSWEFEGHPCHGHPRARQLTLIREAGAHRVGQYWIPKLRKSAIDGMERASRGRFRMAGMDATHIFHYWSAYVTHGMDNLRILWEQGGRERVACGNDAGATWVGYASIPIEIEMLDLCLNAGGEKLMSAADALRVATINSARALGLEDRHGSIEEGKAADLVVMDGDPLEDQRLIGSRAAAVMMDGLFVADACGLQP
jgi:imidazolonepropionase-like amidohydrolase